MTGQMKSQAKPRYMSPVPDEVDMNAIVWGSLHTGKALFEQGMEVARLILARDEDGLPLYPQVAILMPRRATKTTSIWTVILGLCHTLPGFRVVTTAQTGVIASQRMREIMGYLEVAGFEDHGGKLYWAGGRERITFPNGSVIWSVKPKSAAFRSEAADIEFFDESGELDPEMSEDLQGGALPLLDTRPMGQVIIAGTPSKSREGLLWNALEEGRNGKPGCGILEYSISDEDDLVLIDEEGKSYVNEPVLRQCHPGIGTLTTYNKIAGRLEKMGREMFEREYGCRFPFTSHMTAISKMQWEKLAKEKQKAPERLALGYDVAPDDSFSCLTAAWRDEDGRPHIAVVKYGPGSGWLPDAIRAAAAKFGNALVGHDIIGANQAVAEALNRSRPGPRLQHKNMKEMMSAAQILTQEINKNRLVHFSQPSLNKAVDGASWRTVNNSGRLFARKASGFDVSPLVSASVALHTYDSLPPKVETIMAFAS
jgi:hypothetical protein